MKIDRNASHVENLNKISSLSVCSKMYIESEVGSANIFRCSPSTYFA